MKLRLGPFAKPARVLDNQLGVRGECGDSWPARQPRAERARDDAAESNQSTGHGVEQHPGPQVQHCQERSRAERHHDADQQPSGGAAKRAGDDQLETGSRSGACGDELGCDRQDEQQQLLGRIEESHHECLLKGMPMAKMEEILDAVEMATAFTKATAPTLVSFSLSLGGSSIQQGREGWSLPECRADAWGGRA